MTLKSRNRLNFTLLIFSLAFFCTTVMLFLIQFFRGAHSFSDFDFFKSDNANFLVQYNTISITAAIFFEQIFTIFSFYILLRAFTKTQAQNLIFFYTFLMGLLLDSIRIIIPLFGISNTYSELLIACGDLCIFSNIIIPLSLLCTIITSDDEQKINIEQLLFSIILLSLFFAAIIPLNTAKIMPNFNVDFSFKKIILIMNIFAYILSIIILIISNVKKRYKQITAIGLTIMIAGLSVLRSTTNYLSLAIGILLSSLGQFLYLKELHNQYLWND